MDTIRKIEFNPSNMTPKIMQMVSSKETSVKESGQAEKCNICGKPVAPKGYFKPNPNKEKKYCICWTEAPASELIN